MRGSVLHPTEYHCQSNMPSWLHTFASACFSGSCCSPGTASYLADSQRLTGYLVYSEGLPIQMDHWSIPSYSFHGAHRDSTTVVLATLDIGSAIRTEAGLSFLGLGVPPPTPSWGNILSEGRQYIKCCAWLTTYSGLAIMLAVLEFNLMGDTLRDLLDPRRRGE